jgi:hypothetical protein
MTRLEPHFGQFISFPKDINRSTHFSTCTITHTTLPAIKLCLVVSSGEALFRVRSHFAKQSLANWRYQVELGNEKKKSNRKDNNIAR